ncbi:MAG: ATP-binding cassette domain-containing protein [Geminicoccaceae bacterium]|nr:ATP-binding cassette domain-containing protein [Geminicoccaceae bacterium]
MSPAGGAEGLSARIVRKEFPAAGDAPPKLVIQQFELDVPANRLTALFGPSGCGKTTTLNLLAGLDQDYQGEIRRPDPARTAYVFQAPRLLPWRTVEDNLRLVQEEADEAAIDHWLGQMRLGDVRKVFPTRLSLGMARRVALARAFVIQPNLLLMDEPFVSLDEPTAARLRLLLLDTLERHPATTLFVTHDLREAAMLAERIAILTPTPSRVAEVIEVGLDPGSRRDPAAVDRARAEVAERIGGLAPQPV